ncbi:MULTISPECIES: hypothetical protein [unclassified Chamaesiphon]|uniref:hypothetical protein n=1 Tax=unclassified Chamaesiphon TaxID=2620921 RepID=UPI00286B357A|nr:MULTISPECIES: hypothetical protein [unclassified Chamaesiphon]
MKSKTTILAIGLFWIVTTVIGIVLLGELDRQQLQLWLQKMGGWAPVLYISIYAIATSLKFNQRPNNANVGGVTCGVMVGIGNY